MSQPYLTLEIKHFYDKESKASKTQQDKPVEPVMVNDAKGYPVEFIMDNNEIIDMQFNYTSEKAMIGKSAIDGLKLKIIGDITTAMNINPLHMYLLRRWSKQKFNELKNQSYGANDKLDKEVIVTCYYGSGKIKRQIIFKNALLCYYTEHLSSDGSKGKFECIFKQRVDLRKSVDILPYNTIYSEEPKKEEPAQEKTEDENKKIIAIDPGHGMNTPGKRTPKFKDGTFMHEREFNQAVANYLKPLLEEADLLVLNVAEAQTGADINGVSNSTRVNTANNNKIKNQYNRPADFYLSIHANAAGMGEEFNSANGIETYACSSVGAEAKSVKFANIIHSQMLKNGYQQKNRGVHQKNFTVLKNTNMPAVLVECGFMTNKEEAMLLKDEVYRKKCAESLAAAIIEIIKQL